MVATMWKNSFFKIFIAISIVGIFIFTPPVQRGVWETLYFLNPFLYIDIRDAWSNKSTIFLLSKLLGPNPVHADIAADILGERKEKIAVPILLIGLRSPLRMTKWRAMRTLGQIGDQRAVKPLMAIIENRAKDENYYRALSALSEMKYEPTLPIVIKMTQGTETERGEAIPMLGKYEDPKLLPILRKIAEQDKEADIRNRAEEAILRINKKAAAVKQQ